MLSRPALGGCASFHIRRDADSSVSGSHVAIFNNLPCGAASEAFVSSSAKDSHEVALAWQAAPLNQPDGGTRHFCGNTLRPTPTSRPISLFTLKNT
ncbi:hypothetical protein ANAPC5_01509 [Anaplasma phagocytophilum]|nr:hypothetical protein ANAPC5_01509 [Anaplasma phagocytophilum]